jgi:hypothetical protein
VPLPDLRGILQRGQPGLFDDIDLEGDFALDDEVEIVFKLQLKGFEIFLRSGDFLVDAFVVLIVGIGFCLVEGSALVVLVGLLQFGQGGRVHLLFESELFFFPPLVDHELVADVLFGIEIVHVLEFPQQDFNVFLLFVAVQVGDGLLVDVVLQLHHVAFV